MPIGDGSQHRGASPKAVQELLGHSEMGTTLRYMHLAPAHHREAIALLEEALPDGGGAPRPSTSHLRRVQ